MQVDEWEVRVQVEEPMLMVFGNLMVMKDVVISLLIFLNHITYLLTALILVLVIVAPNYTIPDATQTISTVPRSTP